MLENEVIQILYPDQNNQQNDATSATIFKLSLDIKLVILEYLDNKSLASLAQACSYFGMLVRTVMSFRIGQVNLVDHLMPKLPPFLNYRAGAVVGSTFYMPFINEKPICYTFDLDHGIWSSHELAVTDLDPIQPQITCAAVNGSKIYLVGGRLIKSYTLSNAIIEIDTTDFSTRIIDSPSGTPPRPRHEHSVDAIGDKYLVVFGGLCYNSVGENDVFVYDISENLWFIPPITGHLPHLRFGHASAVIGNSLYIHGGAQLDNDSSYIVYDDLYKLDCQSWVWYKYEHPEVERYLRTQIPTTTSDEFPQRNHLIGTTGDSPYDRFQSCMCAYGNKLIVFGGHSIRQDEHDNEILYSYPIDELSIFNAKRKAWTVMRATTNYKQKQAAQIDQDSIDYGDEGVIADDAQDEQDEGEPITVSDMSIASIPMGSRGVRIYIFAGKKAAEVPRSNQYKYTEVHDNRSHNSFTSSSKHSTNTDSSYGSNTSFPAPDSSSLHQTQHHHAAHSSLPSISEFELPQNHNHDQQSAVTDSRDNMDVDKENYEEAEYDAEYEDDEKSHSHETSQGDVRDPNNSGLSKDVQKLFSVIDPDMEELRFQKQAEEDNKRSRLTRNRRQSSSGSSSAQHTSKKKLKPKRPPLNLIHQDESSNILQQENTNSSTDIMYLKHASSSSHSSYSSGGDSFGNRKSKHQRKITPCTLVLDLIE